MLRLVKSLLIGAVAGLMDVVPMIVLGTTSHAIASAFLHWVLLGFVIAYVSLPVPHWVKGLILGLAAAVPVIALVLGDEPTAVIPIVVFSAFLGVGVGAATGRWATGGSASQ
jgi:hypothetical protein